MNPPQATYRLQLGPHLSFDDAARLAPYLAELGISHCYLSPFFETSAQDSSHGYDVSDHGRFRAALGGEPGFARFAQALARQGLELLIDIVPNHMGIGGHHNTWWLDVLEFGPSAAHAPYFDIDWTPVKRELAGKALLPILGDHYGAILERGELKLELHDGGFEIRYHETVLPVSPTSYGRILSHRLEELQARLGADDLALVELKAVTTWFVTLPIRPESDPEALAERLRHRELGRQRLAALLESSPPVRAFVEENLRRFNGTPGDPRSFDLLDTLLSDQAYRVAFWRVSGEEINYRRFFDVDELAAIRMERADVFAEAHVLVARLLRDGIVSGLRIDHPDGLYAPAEYFRRLQELAGPVYVIAEKILAPGERLPAAWDVAGTTGYETLNLLNGIFVDRTQARTLDLLYRRHTHDPVAFTEIVYESKRLIMETVMASEIAMLAHRLNIISERHRSTRDFTLGPDNRRPVDWALRERLLEGLATQIRMAHDRAGLTRDLVKSWEDGRVKLYVIREALAARRSHVALFQRGDYAPLEATGGLAEHVCAFARVAPDDAAIVIVPRLLARRGAEMLPLGRGDWADTRLALPGEGAGSFTNVFTAATISVDDGTLLVADALGEFPVALLTRAA